MLPRSLIYPSRGCRIWYLFPRLINPYVLYLMLLDLLNTVRELSPGLVEGIYVDGDPSRSPFKIHPRPHSNYNHPPALDIPAIRGHVISGTSHLSISMTSRDRADKPKSQNLIILTKATEHVYEAFVHHCRLKWWLGFRASAAMATFTPLQNKPYLLVCVVVVVVDKEGARRRKAITTAHKNSLVLRMPTIQIQHTNLSSSTTLHPAHGDNSSKIRSPISLLTLPSTSALLLLPIPPTPPIPTHP